MGRFWQLKFRLELREEDRPSLAQALALTLALSLTLALALALAQASALAQVFVQILLQRERLFWKNQGGQQFCGSFKRDRNAYNLMNKEKATDRPRNWKNLVGHL